MENDVLKTGADDLYELVKARKKLSVEDAAKSLKMPVDTVHALVDFLVEDKLFGIEYKFTTPYIYIAGAKKSENENTVGKKIWSKEEFFQNAKKWNLQTSAIGELWSNYINENFEYIKAEFYRKARIRNLPYEKIDELWKRYLAYLR